MLATMSDARSGSSAFDRSAATRRKQRGLGKPETFNFLGFTLICGKTRRVFQIHRKTRRGRMTAKLKEVKEELRRRMHRPIPEQGLWLKQVITGFFAYHAVPTNFLSLQRFRTHVTVLWLRTLRRRSQERPSIARKRKCLFAETAESMFSPYRALVALTTGVLPLGAHVVPA